MKLDLGDAYEFPGWGDRMVSDDKALVSSGEEPIDASNV